MSTYKVVKKGYEVVVSGKKYPYNQAFQANPADVAGALKEKVVEEVTITAKAEPVKPSSATQDKPVAPAQPAK